MRYVIAGGGVAGTTAAEELRKLDKEAEIILISEEQHPLYSRVLLTPYLVGKVSRERVFIKKEEWYREQNIEWLCGERVEKLDTKNSFVEISSGREIEYDKLLIATGAETRHSYLDLRGVVHLKNLSDTDHIHQLLKEQKQGASVMLYGGGFISCDFLEIFEKFKMKMTIAFRGPYFWSQVLERELGEMINQHLRDKGVTVLPETEVLDVNGEKELETVVTNNGEIEATILAVGIGTEKDFSWIKEAGIEIGNGIKCNEFLETTVSNIFVAGDIAEFYDCIVERHLCVGTWLNAIMQGRAAAKNMFGQKTEYEFVSSYATTALGLSIIFIGDTSREAADNIRVLRDSKGKTQIFERAGRIVGAILINMNTQRPIITEMIKNKRIASEFFV